MSRSAEPVSASPGATVRRSQLQLGAYPSAVPCARLHARHVLAEWGLADLAYDAELVVAELLSNAVRASADGSVCFVVLKLVAGDGCLSVGVWDGSPAMPAPRPHEIDSDSGRGFEIITMLSESIVVIPGESGAGKTVWAHLRYH